MEVKTPVLQWLNEQNLNMELLEYIMAKNIFAVNVVGEKINNMPYYRRSGKNQIPLRHSEFTEALNSGHFVRREHKGLLSLIYYSGVRRSEAVRSVKEQFSLTPSEVIYDVGKRLKRGKHTPPLHFPMRLEGVEIISECVEATKPKKRVWPYSDRTAYNIVDRALATYPHHLRLSRITNFFLQDYNIAQVRSWSGLTLISLEYYVGVADITKMGKDLGENI